MSNELIILLIAGVVFVVIGIIGVIFLRKMLNKTKEDAKNNPVYNSTESHSDSTQGFLPYDDICGDMYKVKNEYRCVLEVSSVNYQLMTEFEQDALESTFKTLMDSMDYVFAFYVQTRELDTRVMVDKFQEDCQKLKETMPQCLDYAKRFVEEFEHGNFEGVIVKKKYLIISSDDLSHMSALTDAEKADIAAEQLTHRCSAVKSILRNMGLTSNLVRYPELIELIMLSLNKDVRGSIDGVTSGEFLTDIVTGNKINDDADFSIEVALKEFEDKFKSIEAMNKLEPEEQILIDAITKDIVHLRDKYSKYKYAVRKPSKKEKPISHDEEYFEL